jgi:hypothetical protein
MSISILILLQNGMGLPISFQSSIGTAKQRFLGGEAYSDLAMTNACSKPLSWHQDKLLWLFDSSTHRMDHNEYLIF